MLRSDINTEISTKTLFISIPPSSLCPFPRGTFQIVPTSLASKMPSLTLLASLLSLLSLNTVAAHEAIVGGHPTTAENYPYQASLEHLGQHVCGGSILNEMTILTAAHCTYEYPNNLTIRAGTSTIGPGGGVYQLSKVTQHPNFDPETGDYDISVLTLSSDITLGPSVRPITLSSATLQPGINCTATGWGFDRENGKVSDQLQAVELETVSRAECRNDYQGIVPITDRMMCTYTPGKDTCQGDSGGPLVYGGVQVGIVGFGLGCARPGYPGVYMDVANEEIHRFIMESMKNLGSLQPPAQQPGSSVSVPSSTALIPSSTSSSMVSSSSIPSSMMPSSTMPSVSMPLTTTTTTMQLSTVQPPTHQLSTEQLTTRPSTTLQWTTLQTSTTSQAAAQQSGGQQPGSCRPKAK